MDNSVHIKLMAMPLDQLENLVRTGREVLIQRQKAQFMPRMVVEFADRAGQKRKMLIEKVNAKNLSGIEIIGGIPTPAKKWRVHPSFCTAA